MAVHHHGQRPGAVRDNRFDAEVHEGRRQTGRQQAYVGSRLKPLTSGKAPPDRPAFQPYWGKPAVRNERGDRGNVGIIRSPVRASILPDCRVDHNGGPPGCFVTEWVLLRRAPGGPWSRAESFSRACHFLRDDHLLGWGERWVCTESEMRRRTQRR